MKRIISVLMLVCLLASFCTVSAFADNTVTVDNNIDFKDVLNGSYDTIILEGVGPFTVFNVDHAVTIQYNSAVTTLEYADDYIPGDIITFLDTKGGGNPGNNDNDNGNPNDGIMLTNTGDGVIDTIEELQDAIDAAPGSTIDLGGPITVTGSASLDLKGCTVQYSGATPGEAMITNNGSLTITDSGNGGEIKYTYTGAPDSSYGKGNYTILNRGSLSVSGGTVRNATTTMSHALSAIDNNSTSSNVSLTVNGGNVVGENNSFGVRLYSNSATNSNSVTVSSGSVTGNRGIYIQLPSSNASTVPTTNVTVSGGSVTATGSYNYAIVTWSGGNGLDNTSINISGGTINGDVSTGYGGPGAETVNISGGTFNSNYIYSFKSEDKISISGGTFTEACANDYASYYLAPGFELKANDDGTYGVVDPNAPTGGGAGQTAVSNPYSVPATGDMSNMPLWSVLLLAFAAVALMTRKKKA